MLNITGYVRSLFRDAALAGLSDAVAVIAPDGDTTPDLTELRAKLAASLAPKMLAAPDDEPEPAGKRKGK